MSEEQWGIEKEDEREEHISILKEERKETERMKRKQTEEMKTEAT